MPLTLLNVVLFNSWFLKLVHLWEKVAAVLKLGSTHSQTLIPGPNLSLVTSPVGEHSSNRTTDIDGEGVKAADKKTDWFQRGVKEAIQINRTVTSDRGATHFPRPTSGSSQHVIVALLGYRFRHVISPASQ